MILFSPIYHFMLWNKLSHIKKLACSSNSYFLRFYINSIQLDKCLVIVLVIHKTGSNVTSMANNYLLVQI